MKPLIIHGYILLLLSSASLGFPFPIMSTGHQVQQSENVANYTQTFPVGVDFWEGDLKYKVRVSQLAFNPNRFVNLLEGTREEYVQTFSPVSVNCVNVKTDEMKLFRVTYNTIMPRSKSNSSREIKVNSEYREMMSSHLDIIINEGGFLVGLRLSKSASKMVQEIKERMAFLFILDPEYLQNVQSRDGLPFTVDENSILGMCPTEYRTIFPPFPPEFSFPPVGNFTELTPSDEFVSTSKVDKFCNPEDLFVVIKETESCKDSLRFVDLPRSKFVSYYLVCGLNREPDTGRFTTFRIIKIYQEGMGLIREAAAALYLLTEVSLLSIERPHETQQG